MKTNLDLIGDYDEALNELRKSWMYLEIGDEEYAKKSLELKEKLWNELHF